MFLTYFLEDNSYAHVDFTVKQYNKRNTVQYLIIDSISSCVFIVDQRNGLSRVKVFKNWNGFIQGEQEHSFSYNIEVTETKQTLALSIINLFFKRKVRIKRIKR